MRKFREILTQILWIAGVMCLAGYFITAGHAAHILGIFATCLLIGAIVA